MYVGLKYLRNWTYLIKIYHGTESVHATLSCTCLCLFRRPASAVKIPVAVYFLLLGNFKNHSALSYMIRNISSLETMYQSNFNCPICFKGAQYSKQPR